MIEIVIRLNDKLLADFVLFIEEQYRDCQCPKKHSDPQVFLSDLLKEMLISHKAHKLAAQRSAEHRERLLATVQTDPIGALVEAMKPLPISKEDMATLKAWMDEYEEED